MCPINTLIYSLAVLIVVHICKPHLQAMFDKPHLTSHDSDSVIEVGAIEGEKKEIETIQTENQSRDRARFLCMMPCLSKAAFASFCFLRMDSEWTQLFFCSDKTVKLLT